MFARQMKWAVLDTEVPELEVTIDGLDRDFSIKCRLDLLPQTPFNLGFCERLF